MSTTKITLFDAERDMVVQVNVSPADAERAATDTVFAARILNKVLREQRLTTSVEESLFSADDSNIINEAFFNDNTSLHSETQECEVSLYRWSTPCVLLLLESYKAMEADLSCGKLSQKKVWDSIAEELRKKGYDVTGTQCSSKLRSLKKTYKNIKDHNSKSGNDRRNWQYFNIMEEIFAKKAWCDPVAVASSSGLSSKQSGRNENLEGSDSGCSLKSNKTTITTLLKKRLRQREEHEEQKMKRHRERMEMDEKFLRVLDKLANK